MTTPVAGTEHDLLPDLATATARARFATSNLASQAFFAAECAVVAEACHAMAARFRAGGRLLVYAEANRRSDAAHVVVEFMHPVVVGKRALPALDLSSAAIAGGDSATLLHRLSTLGRPGDLLMVLVDADLDDGATALIAEAVQRGMLPIVLTGAAAGPGDASDGFRFAVPSMDRHVVQEVHEMLYHVLWELVHVFLDHEGAAA